MGAQRQTSSQQHSASKQTNITQVKTRKDKGDKNIQDKMMRCEDTHVASVSIHFAIFIYCFELIF